MVDTFIADDTTWEELKRLERAIANSSSDVVNRIKLRIERATLFFDYMLKLYAPLQEEANRRSLPKEWRTNPLTAVRNTFVENLNKALASAERNYGR